MTFQAIRSFMHLFVLYCCCSLSFFFSAWLFAFAFIFWLSLIIYVVLSFQLMMNTEFLLLLRTKILQNLKEIEFAPSVQMQQVSVSRTNMLALDSFFAFYLVYDPIRSDSLLKWLVNKRLLLMLLWLMQMPPDFFLRQPLESSPDVRFPGKIFQSISCCHPSGIALIYL